MPRLRHRVRRPASDAEVRLTNETPDPAPTSTSAGTICPYDADACSCVASSRPTIDRLMPEKHHGLLRKPANEDPAGQLRRQEHASGHGQERESRRAAASSPGRPAGTGDEEEHPVHAGVDESAGDVGRRSGAMGQQPQRQDRLLGPALGAHERREQDHAGDQGADRQRARPTRRCRPRRDRTRCGSSRRSR